MTPTKAPSKGKQKRTYVLSAAVLEQLESRIAPGKRGEFVGAAIQKQLEEARLDEIRARMEEYFQEEEAQALDAGIDREWAPVSDELWAQLPDEDWPEPAVVFPRGYAAYLAENQSDKDSNSHAK